MARESPSVYFWSQYESVAPGSEFQVSVFLDSPEPLNAISFRVEYPADVLELRGFDSRDSVVDIWRGNPEIVAPGVLEFQGGMTEPFAGGGGEIIKINFRALKEGKAVFRVSESKIYLSDGKGTEVIPDMASAELAINATSSLVGIVSPEDSTPPVFLEFGLEKEPVGGKDLLVFKTEDKESGVKYTVYRFKKWFFWSDWIGVENPLQVPPGVWALQLKAVDGSGKSAEKTVYLWNEIIKKSGILVGIIILVMISAIFYNKYRIGKR